MVVRWAKIYHFFICQLCQQLPTLAEPAGTATCLAGLSLSNCPQHYLSLVTINPDRLRFHVPHLTNFHFEQTEFCAANWPTGLGDDLLNFFRSCPLLEVVFLSYSDEVPGLATDETSTKAISLPHLRSFTHETTVQSIHIDLFNRLSLPPTCVVGFVIDVTAHGYIPQLSRFPVPRDQSYFSDVKRVNVVAHSAGEGHASHFMLKTELVNSRNMKISFTKRSYSSRNPCSYQFDPFLDFLDDFGITHSVESLHFEDYPVPSWGWREQAERYLAQQLQKFCSLKSLALWGCDPVVFLARPSPSGLWCPTIEKLVIGWRLGKYCWDGGESEVVERVRDVAVARQKDGSPLKVIALFFRTAETLLGEFKGEIEELKSCVELVEVGGLRPRRSALDGRIR